MLARRTLPVLPLAGQVPRRKSAAMGAALATRAYLRPATCRGPRSLPWVWPADQDTIPERRFSPNTAPLWLRARDLVLKKVQRMLVPRALLGRDYTETIQQTMVPEILQNVIQAVNERDRGACQQIMLPGLARQFGLGMDELRSDGSTLHIEARNVRDVVVESPIWWIGPSAAYDTRVARATRGSRYLYWTNGAIVNALDKEVLRKGTRKREDIMMEVMSCPATLQLNFCMTADIEVSRTKRGKVVDCDRGTMAVPLSLSTPTYPSHRSLPVAVDGNRIIYTSRGTPPLVWRVSDVFRLVMNKELGWNLYK